MTDSNVTDVTSDASLVRCLSQQTLANADSDVLAAGDLGFWVNMSRPPSLPSPLLPPFFLAIRLPCNLQAAGPW